MIPFFMIACLNRFLNSSLTVKLKTDLFSKFLMLVTIIFYAMDTTVKYLVDGADGICERAFIMHHVAAIIILIPMILHSYVPWWLNPIGFMHGFCVVLPGYLFIHIGYFIAMMLISVFLWK